MIKKPIRGVENLKIATQKRTDMKNDNNKKMYAEFYIKSDNKRCIQRI